MKTLILKVVANDGKEFSFDVPVNEIIKVISDAYDDIHLNKEEIQFGDFLTMKIDELKLFYVCPLI